MSSVRVLPLSDLDLPKTLAVLSLAWQFVSCRRRRRSETMTRNSPGSGTGTSSRMTTAGAKAIVKTWVDASCDFCSLLRNSIDFHVRFLEYGLFQSVGKHVLVILVPDFRHTKASYFCSAIMLKFVAKSVLGVLLWSSAAVDQ